jgi:hypothetical protein
MGRPNRSGPRAGSLRPGLPRSLGAAIACACAGIWLSACGAPAEPRYPSYEAIVAQYVPIDSYRGVPLDDQAAYPATPYCNCPRIWYHDHWVYYYHDQWIYWHHGYWYHYPIFYVYYWEGLPYVYAGPHRSIIKDPDTGSAPATGDGIAPRSRTSKRAGTSSGRSSARPVRRKSPPPARNSSSSGSRSEQERKKHR